MSTDSLETQAVNDYNQRHPDQEVQKDNWENFKRPADEQEYSTEVSHNSQMDPTQNELNDLSQACNKLWELDYNRLTSYETV
ncbi:hypothetical protein LXL04_022419 [Taraxacum kok-saghyz]